MDRPPHGLDIPGDAGRRRVKTSRLTRIFTVNRSHVGGDCLKLRLVEREIGVTQSPIGSASAKERGSLAI